MSNNPFNRTTLWVVVGVALASLAVTIVLTVMTPPQKFSAGSDGYSVSAIGHKGLVELLGKLDIPVVLSRNNSATKSASGLLIIAEPKITEAETERLKGLIETAPHNVLVVLPKWYGYAGDKGRWIDAADLQPLSDIAQVTKAIGLDAEDPVSRTLTSPVWTAHGAFPTPKIKLQTQGLAIDLVTPEISDGQRALLGHFEKDRKELWVLADPDVINNAGLSQPENAALAVALIDKLREGGPVVFDETVHGHAQTPSLMHVLFEFPLVLVTMQVLICAVLVLWAAMVRFGPQRSPPPPLAPGKDFLIANTAALLRYGGHDHDALERYLTANIAVVRHALHAPDSLGPTALVAWLERVHKARSGTANALSLAELQELVTASRGPQRVLEVADQVYRWRMEMIHGSTNRS